MTIETTAIMGTVLGGIAVSAIICVAKHVSNDETHPKKPDIVFKDVCESKMKGSQDCVEVEIKAVNQRLDNMDKKLDILISK